MDHDPVNIPLSLEELRMIGLWAAECAERVLLLFQAKAPADTRPREVDDPAAIAAARAAGLAASSTYTHPLATLQNAKHILGPAVYAARAREFAAAGVPAIGNAEIRWAIGDTPPEVREVVQRMPARSPGRSRLDAFYFQIDKGLRR